MRRDSRLLSAWYLDAQFSSHAQERRCTIDGFGRSHDVPDQRVTSAEHLVSRESTRTIQNEIAE